jgi:uncharacterized membrane protein
MKRLANWFLQGLIFLAPIAFTVFVFYKVFVTVDGWIGGWLGGWLGVTVPGAGFAVTVGVVLIIGMLASHFITGSVLRAVERLIERLPFVKLLHSSVKDLLNAFVGEKRRFGKPVLVELFPGSGVRLVGFVTRDSAAALGFDTHVTVYFPQSYNFAGQLAVVPRERVTPLEASSAEVMTMVVSGGVSGAGSDDAPPALTPPPPAPGASRT